MAKLQLLLFKKSNHFIKQMRTTLMKNPPSYLFLKSQYKIVVCRIFTTILLVVRLVQDCCKDDFSSHFTCAMPKLQYCCKIGKKLLPYGKLINGNLATILYKNKIFTKNNNTMGLKNYKHFFSVSSF